MMPIIVEATVRQCFQMAPHLRQAEVDEVGALAMSPLYALIYSLTHSLQAWTWLVDDKPAAMWGLRVDSMLGNYAVAWLLTTDAVEKYPITFIKGCLKERDRMKQSFAVLENFVDARHETCLRWLQWLGFDIEAPKPFGPHQQLFCRVRG
jgi:hypothetical protein